MIFEYWKSLIFTNQQRFTRWRWWFLIRGTCAGGYCNNINRFLFFFNSEIACEILLLEFDLKFGVMWLQIGETMDRCGSKAFSQR